MLENVQQIFYNSPADDNTGKVWHITHKHCDDALFEFIESNCDSTSPIVVINSKATLPPFYLERLLQPFSDFGVCHFISCLTTENYLLSPLAHDSGFKGNCLDLDHSIYILQKPGVFLSDTFNNNAFAVRNLSFLKSQEMFVTNNLLVNVETGNKRSVIGAQAPDIGDQLPLPAHPLAELHLKLDQASGCFKPHTYPGLNQQPNVLHVLMNWGGGVQKWVDDFISASTGMNHFILVSEGEFFRHCQGEKLKLYWHQSSNTPIEEYHLSKPIRSVALTHVEYQSYLKEVLAEYDIQALFVSSLIGHSMDCLNTGLPTVRILHDYFPHWPSLNAQLDADVIDNLAIEQALNQTSNEPFGLITSSEFSAFQQANNRLLSQPGVQIVAPDQSVISNLLKLDFSDCYQSAQVIAHGSQSIKPIAYQAKAQPFTVLVLGRISQPKGQQLLHACIQSLESQPDFSFVLLGAGKAGTEFESYQNVTVIPDYQHQNLREAVTQTSPQLALLTSLTSETYSYTLTELQMLGVPVLATAVGAFKNRIKNEGDGFLLEPQASLITSEIQKLSDQPALLEHVRAQGLKHSVSSPEENAAAYLNLISSAVAPCAQYRVQSLIKPNHLAQQIAFKKLAITRLEAQKIDLQSNLKEKLEWANSLSSHIKHLEKNIDSERDEKAHLLSTLKQEQSRHFKEANDLKSTITNINDKLSESNRISEKLESSLQHKQAVLDQKQKTLLAKENEINALLNSRSWRITKPLRSFTTWARHKRNAIKYRLNQFKGLPKRVNNSLKTRGFRSTVNIAVSKFKKAKPVTTPIEVHEIKETYAPLTIDTSASPQVSIIIPVYNQYKHTYHCLESLARLKDNTAFEVIVVNDCSTDDTADQLKSIVGIKAHTQVQNGGFIESCNTGANLAQGEYLLFLNNDTEVMPGWLDALLKTFETHPDVGLVGSQLIYPDGRLQEAGGIVFSDASGWNYGRFDQPDLPEYQHVREVSYCSGASIMIKSSLFTQLGQFDQRYKPAYYEDTDLSFAVREHGLKVYYQPQSRIIHFEGISSGTDLTSGTKKYQVVNQQKFLEKWHKQLQHQPKAGTNIEQARFQNQPKRVLILDACTPTPDQDSGSLRMLNLMQIFIELGYQVSFIPENMAHFKHYTTDLQQLGVECVYTPKYNSPIDYLKTKGDVFDLVILSRYYVAKPVMSAIQSYCPQAQTWFDTVDLHYLREHRMAELANDDSLIKAAEKTKQQELSIAAGCDLTLVVSPYEQTVLAETVPEVKVDVLSNIHEVYGNQRTFVERQDIMFIGGYQHTPNVDGILWFVEQIFPEICNELPDIKLHIIGSKAPKEVEALGQHPNIEFHGFVENIEPFMQQIRIAVAPLRFGAGVKGKVNMSMSYGQPVVGTKVAVEGMYTTHEKDVMMADDPQQFAQDVVRLYQDEVLWNEISAGGLANVERWFSFNAAKQQVKKLLAASH